MHVTLLSIVCRVKTVLSFLKSRVFSRTHFQSEARSLRKTPAVLCWQPPPLALVSILRSASFDALVWGKPPLL